MYMYIYIVHNIGIIYVELFMDLILGNPGA